VGDVFGVSSSSPVAVPSGVCTHVLHQSSMTHLPARALGIRELRNQVAAAVRRASAGEVLTVTVDGRPAAQLGPLDASTDAGGLSQLIASGQLRPPVSDQRPRPDPSPLLHGTDPRPDRLLREVRGR
jgi:prevent-host-death family protein